MACLKSSGIFFTFFVSLIVGILLSLATINNIMAASNFEERLKNLETQQEVNKAITEKDKELKELIEKEIQRSMEVQKQIHESASNTISWVGTIATILSVGIGIVVSLLAWLGFRTYKDSINEIKSKFEEELKGIRHEVEQYRIRVIEAAEEIEGKLGDVRKLKIPTDYPENITDEEKKTLNEVALTFDIAKKFGVKLKGADYIKIATKHLIEKNYESVIENTTKAIELQPDNALAYSYLGIALAKLNRDEEAIERFKKAIELQPDNALAYSFWGAELSDLGRHEEAIEKYKKAIELNPNSARDYYNWGFSMAGLHRHEEAIEKYKKAIELKPDHYMAYSNWGVALGKLHRYEEAIEKYKKAIELKPDQALSYFNAACGYAKLGNVNYCCENLKKAISMDSKYKKMALEDSDFDRVKTEPCIKQLTSATD